jgi:hypothetical protein
MKKITLLLALLISSIGFSQTYDLLESFNSSGLEDAFGGTAAEYATDPTGSDQVVQITSSATGQTWQGVNVVLTSNYRLTSATQLTMQLDVYSTTAITIAPKAQGGVSGSPDSVTSVDHAGSGWETLTFTFDQSLDGKVPANGDYADFALHINWDTAANSFGAADSRMFYIKNLKGLTAAAVPDVAPTTSAPTPPTFNAGDVVSFFSDAYTNTAIDTWSASWDDSSEENVQIDGGTVKKISFGNFIGVEFQNAGRINATDFTHFHIDIWTDTDTETKSFNLKFSDWAGGSAEVSAIEFSTTNASSPALTNPNPGTWISLDIPFSSWTSGSRADLAQFIITSNLGTVYVDNIYMYKAGTASVDTQNLLNVSLSPSPAKDQLKISAENTIERAAIYSVLGKQVKSVIINKKSDFIDVSTLSTGIYILKYTVNNTVGSMKFIKE